MRYPLKKFTYYFIAVSCIAMVSCKKDNVNNNNKNNSQDVIASPTKLGLYEADSAEYRELIVAISKVGTQSIDEGLVFDTGSGGMVLDAKGIVPPSMVTSAGFNFTGDSTVVNGITITNQTSTLQYGADSSTLTTVYGNLAYAPVTIGDQGENVVIKRLPFCIYYKATDAQGDTLPSHYFDTFGVNPEYIYFSGGAHITSPFSSYQVGNGLTKGFKMEALGTTNFSYQGTYVAGVVSLGLTPSDVSSSSGFTMHQCNFYQGDGYVPIFTTTVTYNSSNVSTYALFDSGTSGFSYIEDPHASGGATQLPQKTKVQAVTNAGFNYTYTIAPDYYLTYVENPNTSGGNFSIFSIDYFLNNEYLMDFANEKMGLKNN